MTAPPHLTSALLSHNSIRHAFFGRRGGVSTGIYASLNCGVGSGDRPDAVHENRARVRSALQADALCTLYQIHSPDALFIGQVPDQRPQADALVTDVPGLAIGVLTADCMPVLLHDPVAGVIGAAHAGWRGTLAGVLSNCVALMQEHGADPARIKAAIGPCLEQRNFEVGLDLVRSFTDAIPDSERFFAPGASPEKRQFDLTGFGRWHLTKAGILPANIDHFDICTMDNPADWYSYRLSRSVNAPDYGRNVAAICLS